MCNTFATTNDCLNWQTDLRKTALAESGFSFSLAIRKQGWYNDCINPSGGIIMSLHVKEAYPKVVAANTHHTLYFRL